MNKELTESMKEVVKGLLSKEIADSAFNSLTIKKVSENSTSLSMDGQTFGVIGALGIVLADISEHGGLPLNTVIALTGLAAEICADAKQYEHHSSSNDTTNFTQMFNSIFGKKEDK